MMIPDTLVLQSPYGGLGDHLFLSHLPRVAKSCGVRRVLVSTRSPFRDPAYRHLIWELNPYVDGFTEEPGLRFVCPPVTSDCNNLDVMMLGHGLDDGQRFHEPELYYEPKLRHDVSGKSIYDPNYVSFVGWLRRDRIDNYFHSRGLRVDLQFALRNRSLPLTNPAPTVVCSSIYDYCDIISSCSRYYGLMSGGAEVAAALKKSGTIFYGPEHAAAFRHSKRHDYRFVGDPAWRIVKAAYYLHRRTRQAVGLPVPRPW